MRWSHVLPLVGLAKLSSFGAAFAHLAVLTNYAGPVLGNTHTDVIALQSPGKEGLIRNSVAKS